MKNFNWKQLLPHVIAVVIFLVIAFIYCKPAFEGKVLQQSDVTQWKGMAQNSFQYYDKHGSVPLWTNGMFCGMPAYQITLKNYNPLSVSIIQNIITLGLVKPANFFFLACICFYFLSQVLKVNPYIGIVGALAYAYATYNPIIIGVGHDTKMISIAYLPAFIAALLLIYEKKYWWGAALTALITALLIGANHMQITYYGIIIAVCMSIAFVIKCIQAKEFKHLITAVTVAIIAGVIGVLVNLVSLYTTYEYAKETIRGGSVLADSKSKLTKTGLSKDYAFSYSMYKTEPLVMLFPRMFGGSSGLEIAEDKSKAIEVLQQMQPPQLAQQLQSYLQFYWGGIGGTSGPPYVGAIICFLAIIGFFIVDKKYKWWILFASSLTIVMSWGQFFDGFNSLLLQYLPLYNKFRAPSMILVVPTFLFCMMAILSLQAITARINVEDLWKQYKKGLLAVAAIFVIAFLVYFTADFSGEHEASLLKQVSQITDAQQKAAIEQPVRSFVNALKEDRQSLFMGDIFRSLFLVVIAASLVWFYIKRKLNSYVLIGVLGIVAFIDVITVDVKYLNSDMYQDEADYESNFKPSAIDVQILKDTSYYRVFNLMQGVNAAFNAGAMPTSYFHKSIGGYHPAKLSIYQDLIEKQLYRFPDCLPVINMLNTKYLITPNQQNGQPQVQENPDNLGPCWFVKNVKAVNSLAEAMNALNYFHPKDTAIVVVGNNKTIADIIASANPLTDSSSFIKLIKNDNDAIEYQSFSSKNEYAVFSEIFYDKGWKAYIDGKEATIVQTNYVLRGLAIPAGKHTITFEFKPSSYYSSAKASIASSVLIWLLLVGAAVQSFIKRKKLSA
jgi:hypothetical protein